MGHQHSNHVRAGVVEELVLMLSLLKWAVLASVTGALIGVGVAMFLHAIQWAVSIGAELPWRVWLLPVGGFVTAWLVTHFAPEAAGHGTEAVIRAIHERAGKVRAAVVPVKALATVITLGVWGSAGKEGPAAQIGSGISSVLADLLRLSDRDRRKLAVCGISAGFAGVFGLPVAGSIFGIEVLAVGGMFYEYLLPSFLAGVSAFQVTRWLGVPFHSFPLASTPALSEVAILKLLAFGSLMGIVALTFIEMMNISHRFFHRLPCPAYVQPALGGLVLVLLALVTSRQYLGLSTDLLELALAGTQVAASAFLLKMLFTSITLGSGYSGGVITPLFVIGATAGSCIGSWLGFPLQVGAAMGVVGLIAGAANTPIAAVLMGIEMFGPGAGVFAAAVAISSFLLSGHRSIYPSQILFTKKSPALHVTANQPIEGQHPGMEWHTVRRIAELRRRLGLTTPHQPSGQH